MNMIANCLHQSFFSLNIQTDLCSATFTVLHIFNIIRLIGNGCNILSIKFSLKLKCIYWKLSAYIRVFRTRNDFFLLLLPGDVFARQFHAHDSMEAEFAHSMCSSHHNIHNLCLIWSNFLSEMSAHHLKVGVRFYY